MKHHPVIGLPSPADENDRERFLSLDEIKTFWEVTGSMTAPWQQYFRFLLLTGQRKGETAALRWEDIDGDLWRLRGVKTKNGKEHTVPLSPEALALLDELPRIGEFAFTTNGRTPIQAQQKMKRNFIDKTIDDFRIHDLRRTLVTQCAERLGMPEHVGDAWTNHRSGSGSKVTAIYNRAAYTEQVRPYAEKWATLVMQTVNAGPNVVALHA